MTEESTESAAILIVEDEAINRLYLSTLLRQKGYAVRKLQSGVQLMNEQPFPDVDVSKALRDRGLSIPIVALTAYSSQSDVDTYRKATMNGFVSKPVSEDTLLRVLKDVLSGSDWSV